MEFLYVLCILAFLLTVIASIMVKVTFSKYNKVETAAGRSAADVARDILDKNGLYNVQVVMGSGTLTDNYNPKTETVTLSESVYGKSTVGAVSVAAHEVGHAIQHAERYAPVELRTAVFPIVSVCSKLWYFMFIFGLILNMIGLIWAAIALFAALTAFQIITLPVELDASRRALATISQNGYLMNYEMKGARKTLNAAAFTYIAALLASLLQLLRLMAMARRR